MANFLQAPLTCTHRVMNCFFQAWPVNALAETTSIETAFGNTREILN